MRSPTIFLFILNLAVHTVFAACAATPKMRPYTGIGILVLKVAGDNLNDPLALYEEPGLSQLRSLNPGKIPGHDWIFGESPASAPFIVTGRKGTWLRVAYDDAGREGWLNPGRTGTFQTWDFFLKDHVSRLLSGLQKRYYQLYLNPDKEVLAQLTG